MQEIKFNKMVASGNDFVVVSQLAGWSVGRLKKLAQDICDRNYGVGADGLLLIEKSKSADVHMRIFNADGSEAQMCGNGARCAALCSARNQRKKVKLKTKAGIIQCQVNNNSVKIKLTAPRNIKLDIPISINSRNLKVSFADTGVPHLVVFVQGLDKMDVVNIGKNLRYHRKFAPRGTNVNFIEVLRADSIKIRTYERGVEDETLACGTGAVAAALIFSLKTGSGNVINVHTRSSEVLKVYFEKSEAGFRDVWLEGKARIVYKGVYYA